MRLAFSPIKFNRLIQWVLLVLLTGCSGVGSFGGFEGSSKKDKGSDDDKKTDEPAEVAGAFLVDADLVSVDRNSAPGKVKVIGQPGSIYAADESKNLPQFMTVWSVPVSSFWSKVALAQLTATLLTKSTVGPDGAFSIELDQAPSAHVIFSPNSMDSETSLILRTSKGGDRPQAILAPWGDKVVGFKPGDVKDVQKGGLLAGPCSVGGVVLPDCILNSHVDVSKGDISIQGSLIIGGGGKLRGPAGTVVNISVGGALIIQDGGELNCNVDLRAAAFIVENRGSVVLSSLGYTGGIVGTFKGSGPGGATSTPCIAGKCGQSGGSYGGSGGGSTDNNQVAPLSSIYGSDKGPMEMGSGGAGALLGLTPGLGGNGGGLLRVTASELIQIDGGIKASGGNGTGGTECIGGGGGSGGGIEFKAPLVSGEGSLSANGGVGAIGSGTCSDIVGGAGGGGGRIYFSSQEISFSGKIEVKGGSKHQGSSATESSPGSISRN